MNSTSSTTNRTGSVYKGQHPWVQSQMLWFSFPPNTLSASLSQFLEYISLNCKRKSGSKVKFSMKSYIFPRSLVVLISENAIAAGKEQKWKMELSLGQLYRANGIVVTNTDTEYFQEVLIHCKFLQQYCKTANNDRRGHSNYMVSNEVLFHGINPEDLGKQNSHKRLWSLTLMFGTFWIAFF